MRKSLLGLCVLAALSSPAFAADPPQTESQRIAALEARIQALETELQQIRASTQAATPGPAAMTTAQAQPPSPTDEIDALAASIEARGISVDSQVQP